MEVLVRKVLSVLWVLTLAAACEELAPPVTAPLKPAYVIPPPIDPCSSTGACTTWTYDGLVLPTQFTTSYCFGSFGSYDRDVDGIRDDCEYQIAKWFRPMLARNNNDEAPERETYWAVKRKPNTSTVQVFYALGYYWDAGESFGFGSHPGDSEFIMLEITNYGWPSVPSLWTLDAATLSAHWGVTGYFEQDHTGTYGYSALEYPSTYRGRPRIWVSKNKHANYRSKDQCNFSGGVDYCDQLRDGTTYEDAEVFESANVGSKNNKLLNCVGSRHPGLYRAGYGVECLWATGAGGFAGWNVNRNGASTGYGTMLEFYGF